MDTSTPPTPTMTTHLGHGEQPDRSKEEGERRRVGRAQAVSLALHRYNNNHNIKYMKITGLCNEDKHHE